MDHDSRRPGREWLERWSLLHLIEGNGRVRVEIRDRELGSRFPIEVISSVEDDVL